MPKLPGVMGRSLKVDEMTFSGLNQSFLPEFLTSKMMLAFSCPFLRMATLTCRTTTQTNGVGSETACWPNTEEVQNLKKRYPDKRWTELTEQCREKISLQKEWMIKNQKEGRMKERRKNETKKERKTGGKKRKKEEQLMNKSKEGRKENCKNKAKTNNRKPPQGTFSNWHKFHWLVMAGL